MIVIFKLEYSETIVLIISKVKIELDDVQAYSQHANSVSRIRAK